MLLCCKNTGNDWKNGSEDNKKREIKMLRKILGPKIKAVETRFRLKQDYISRQKRSLNLIKKKRLL